MRHTKSVDKKPKDIAWDLFVQTGEAGYYMLYKNLKDDDE